MSQPTAKKYICAKCLTVSDNLESLKSHICNKSVNISHNGIASLVAKKLLPIKTENDVLSLSPAQNTATAQTIPVIRDVYESDEDSQDESHISTPHCEWSDTEVRLLLSEYGKSKRFYEDCSMRVKYHWSQISKVLSQHGYNKTALQCEYKFGNLRSKYRTTKGLLRRSIKVEIPYSYWKELDDIWSSSHLDNSQVNVSDTEIDLNTQTKENSMSESIDDTMEVETCTSQTTQTSQSPSESISDESSKNISDVLNFLQESAAQDRQLRIQHHQEQMTLFKSILDALGVIGQISEK